MEIRHDSFRCDDFVDLLRKHGVALVVADTAGKWPLLEDVTAGFMYLRLHGDAELYVSGYSDPALDDWARRIRAWSVGGEPRGARKAGTSAPRKRKSRDVYTYFDNDVKVHAPFDALGLMERLGQRPRAARATPGQPRAGSRGAESRSSWPAVRRATRGTPAAR